jgi:hypothetical protein
VQSLSVVAYVTLRIFRALFRETIRPRRRAISGRDPAQENPAACQLSRLSLCGRDQILFAESLPHDPYPIRRMLACEGEGPIRALRRGQQADPSRVRTMICRWRRQFARRIAGAINHEIEGEDFG